MSFSHLGLQRRAQRYAAFLLTSSVVLSQVSLTAPMALAQNRCATGFTASASAIEDQASFADSYRELHQFSTGNQVRVAIIDTGITPHPRLPEIHDAGDFLQDATGGALKDCDGHGTIVASVLAAQDTGDGIVGLAPDVELISIRQTTTQVRNLEEQDTSVATLIRAIDAALEAKAQIINLSLAACLPANEKVDLSELTAVLERAERQEVVVVAAAGNHSAQCDDSSQVFPAAFDTVVAVSAHTVDLEFADFALLPELPFISTRGAVSAAVSFHGSDLVGGLGSVDNPNYFAGTSFATPVVSGTAALLKQRYPQATAQEIRERLYAGTDDYHQVFSPARALLSPAGASSDIAAYHLPESANRTTTTAVADSLADANLARLHYLLWVLLALGIIGFVGGKIASKKRDC